MKYLFLTLVGILFIHYTASSQCTPDHTINKTGIYYNSTNLPCLNTPFDETLQLVIINDSSINFGGVSLNLKLDSIEITDVLNLPSGLTHLCENSACIVHKEIGKTHSHTCLRLLGTPTSVTTNNIVTLKTILHGQTTFGAQSVPYELTIPLNTIDCVVAIEDELSQAPFSIFPQPIDETAQASLFLNSNAKVEINVHNMLGENVGKAFSGTLSAGSQQIDLSNTIESLSAGMYMVNTIIEINGQTKSLVKRIVVQ